MISIVDYGMGNLRSVSKAFETQGYEVSVTNSPEDINISSGLVLPGVGAFGECMANLGRLGLIEPIKDYIKSGRPFLGICLGFQILFEESEESPGVNGLGLYKGKVVRFPDFGEKRIKVPQMGWNTIKFDSGLSVLKNIPEGTWFYFVHSYYVDPGKNGLSLLPRLQKKIFLHVSFILKRVESMDLPLLRTLLSLLLKVSFCKLRCKPHNF